MGGAIYILLKCIQLESATQCASSQFYNIHGHDEDLEAGTVMRFSKHAKWRAIHRFQHFILSFYMD